MALINIREVYPGVSLGLWQMEETVEQLYDRYSWMEKYRALLSEHYKNEGRKKEFLAVRGLLHEMLGEKVGRLPTTRLASRCSKTIM